MPADQHGPLAGIRVLDLTHVMAGPTCTLMLADMGADVVKIEKLPAGDDLRGDVEPYNINGVSASFMMVNRNKRSLGLDLKTDGGKLVLRRLLEDADVLVENYRGGTMERLGFDYEALRKDYPQLIYCAISGFGRTGPYANRGGFDLITQGMSGLMSITGEGPGRPPVKVGAPLTDITAGILAAMGIVGALYHRTQTGEGQMVDTSLLEAGIIHTFWQSAIAFATGRSPGPLGSAHPLNAPYQAIRTADGWITIGAANQANWLRLLDMLDSPELANDPGFEENPGRMANLPALEDVLNRLFGQRPSAEWLDRLEQAGIPAGPILSVGEMHRDPQVRARNMVPEVQHPVAGPVQTLGPPVKFSATPARVRRPAPLLGEHSHEVLQAHGFTAAEIQRLAAEGAIRLGDAAVEEEDLRRQVGT